MATSQQQLTDTDQQILNSLQQHWALLADKRNTTYLEEKNAFMARMEELNKSMDSPKE